MPCGLDRQHAKSPFGFKHAAFLGPVPLALELATFDKPRHHDNHRGVFLPDHLPKVANGVSEWPHGSNVAAGSGWLVGCQTRTAYVVGVDVPAPRTVAIRRPLCFGTHSELNSRARVWQHVSVPVQVCCPRGQLVWPNGVAQRNRHPVCLCERFHHHFHWTTIRGG
jgi:hypothetical protein